MVEPVKQDRLGASLPLRTPEGQWTAPINQCASGLGNRSVPSSPGPDNMTVTLAAMFCQALIAVISAQLAQRYILLQRKRRSNRTVSWFRWFLSQRFFNRARSAEAVGLHEFDQKEENDFHEALKMANCAVFEEKLSNCPEIQSTQECSSRLHRAMFSNAGQCFFRSIDWSSRGQIDYTFISIINILLF